MVNYNNWIKGLKASYKDEGRNYSLKELKRIFPHSCREHQNIIELEKDEV